MRHWRLNLHSFSVLLILGTSIAGPCAYGELNNDDENFKSFATEYEFEYPGEDPIKITDVSGKVENPEQVIEQTAQIENSAKGDKHVPVFLNQGEESKLTPELRSALQKQGLIVDAVIIPRAVQKKLKAAYEYLFKGIYQKPEARDWTVGFVLGSMRTAISAGAYFSAPGVSPLLATQLTAASAFVTFSHTVYGDTVENAMWKGIKNKLSKWGKAQFWAKDFAYSLMIVNLMNNIPGYALVDPWQLNTSMAPMIALGSANGTFRRSLLQGVKKTHLNTAYAITVMPFLYVFQGMESAGLLEPWFRIGYYEVKPSIIAAFMTYATLIVRSNFYPNQMIARLERSHLKVDPPLKRLENSFKRFLGRFSFPTKKHCPHLFKKAREEPAAPPDEAAALDETYPALVWLHEGYP